MQLSQEEIVLVYSALTHAISFIERAAFPKEIPFAKLLPQLQRLRKKIEREHPELKG